MKMFGRPDRKGPKPDEESIALLMDMLGAANEETLSGCRQVIAAALMHSEQNDTGFEAYRWASESLKVYKEPGWVPARLDLDADTVAEMKRVKGLHRHEGSAIRRMLAEMLLAMVPDVDLDGCAAIAFSGDNAAIGHTQFSVLAR